jgi:hypothetical protein
VTTPKDDDEQVQFTLVENGLDFVWSAVEHLSTAASKGELKYALLHLVSGIELILKEKLRREDWKLIFDKPEHATEAKYEAGDFTSVKFDSLMERLEEFCDIEFSEEALLALRTVRRKRNRFEHFAADESAEAVIASTATALGVILDFISKELDGGKSAFTRPERALLRDIRGKLAELAAFVESRRKSIAPKLEKAYAVLPCPGCQEDALTIDDGTECLFCGYKGDGEVAANAYVANILGINRFRFEKDGGIWPVGICPDCDWQSCVDADSEGYMCFGCGTRWEHGELGECGRCGRYLSRDNDIGICDHCISEQMARDD